MMITIWHSYEDAAEVKRRWDSLGCGAYCNRDRHRIVAIDLDASQSTKI
jgi:hypothetical protein